MGPRFVKTAVALGLLLALGPWPAFGEPRQDGSVRKVAAKVRYVTGDTLYLDVGREDGVATGDVVVVSRPPLAKLRLKVTATARTSASVSVAPEDVPSLAVGQRAVVLTRRRKKAAPRKSGVGPDRAAAKEDPRRAWKGARPAGDDPSLPEDFQPLLAPVSRAAAEREGAPLFVLDGRITLSGSTLRDEEVERDWQRVRAYGSIELSELGGTDWRLVARASANAQFEADKEDSEQVRVHELTLAHEPREGQHRLRLGRFFFDPLPAVGQIDGVHGELRLGEGPFFVGAAGGLRPDPGQEALDAERATAAAYGAFRSDPRRDVSLSTNVGFFATSTRSKRDRSAVTGTQVLSLFRTVTFVGQQVVDLYDTDDRREGLRLTRAHADLRIQLQPWLYIGGGYDQNELPDTADAVEYFPNVARLEATRSRRAYAYAGQRLGAGWSLTQRGAIVRLAGGVDQISVNAGASKLGVFSEGDLLVFGYRGLLGGHTEVHRAYVELLKELPYAFHLRGRYQPQLISPDGGDDLIQHEFILGADWDLGALALTVEGAAIVGDDVALYRGFASLTWRF